MPSASENASAIAIVSIPPIITGFEWVPECRPTINPRVVIIPEVIPKLNPVFSDCFIIIFNTANLNNPFALKINLMPYAAKDRQEFIKRISLNPDARILDIGGLLSEELPSAISGLTAPRHASNAIILKPWYLPLKNSVFNAAVSYHYFDLLAPDMLSSVFSEVARILNTESIFSFMITLWIPKNKSQRSNLFFNEVLKTKGALFQHEFEEISRQLSISGFREITVESVKRDIIIPREFIRSHLLMLGKLVKKEKEEWGTGVKTLARQYCDHVKEHGEAMLPALHFTATKL